MRREGDIPLLYFVSESVAPCTDLEEALNRVMQGIAENMGITYAFLSVLNRNSSRIFIEAAYGLTEEQLERGDY
jgi:signal transduction protein with GAF and PtsI domain